MICIGNQTACWAASPSEPFDYAVANGFDAFEWFPDKKIGAGWDEDNLSVAQRCKIRETALARGMRLSVHARWQANPLESGSQALFEKDVQLAEDLGARLLNIHLYLERGVFAYVEAILPLIRRLIDSGMQLAIENTPSHSPENFNELFAQLRRVAPSALEHLGMCFDLGHANLCAATRNDYLQFLDRLIPQVPIIHVHLHENYGDADTHLPLFTGPAGHDASGIRGLVKRLRERHFIGSMILEQWPQPPALLNQARDKLLLLLDETVISAPAGPMPSPKVSIAMDAFARQLVEGDRRSKSWREKLDFVRNLLTRESLEFTAEQLVDMAIYLRFLGTGEIACTDDGRHFRPAHHARIALQIRERLAKFSTPDMAFIVRKIYPWLPSSAREFQRAEPLTRIRDIAHRNDIPSELKREIKHSLQNKLHRCAGPEDLATSAALLKRITAPGSGYAPAFVEQFRIFHEELKEFFNARALDERLNALLPAVSGKVARLIRNFLAQKRETSLPAQMTAFNLLTELRRDLITEVERVPELARQEFLLADISLEDFAFALLSEMVNALELNTNEANWQALFEVTQQTLTNLELSRVEPDECNGIGAELRAWTQAFEPADREQLLRMKATINRARRLAENYSDRIMAWFPPRALALGRALGVPEAAIQVFGDAEIRSHLIFQLSKLISHILRQIRQQLALPAWDVVVSGEATGRLKLADRLDGAFSEPTLVLLKQAEGDEEIPAGVTGIVLAHDLPHLSHLGVRARQAGVVLVACEEPAQFAELAQQDGNSFLLAASAESVQWKSSTEVAPAAGPPAFKLRPPKVLLIPDTTWIPLEEATVKYGGYKADSVRRLMELSQRDEAGFKVPTAIVVPFGAMEQALRAAPKIEMEYCRIVERINTTTEGLPAGAKRLHELVQQLPLPPEITAGVQQKFDRHVRLMARSSANDEDLPEFAAAGLYESVANVMPGGIAPAVRAVWASLWTRRAVLSRHQAGIPQSHAHMAVLIQQMLAPNFSFILHTVNPINRNRCEAYVEIVVGLGETLASAASRGNPWRFVCDKDSGATTVLAFANYRDALGPDTNGGLMRKIVDYSRIPFSLEAAARQQLGKKLADIARLVETTFGGPQDIEGVLEGDAIYLVQSRPQQGLEKP